MKRIGGIISLIFAIIFFGGIIGGIMEFDIKMFLLSTMLFAFFAWMFVLAYKEEPKERYDPWPCPRCANNYVDLYDQGKWLYFTCGSCGARGWYPFRTLEQRLFRAN